VRPVDSDSAPAPVVDVRVVLPDHWWVIPLQPQQARDRSVERLVERQFGSCQVNRDS
jgi:RNase adaptor protein for sRNA GlmZ degradation